jgi:hypothetical protein
MSADTKALNVGVTAPPEVGPAHTVLANSVARLKVNAGVLVGVATEVVMIEPMFPALKDVTVPLPPAEGTYADMLEPDTWNVTLVFPPGAAGVVPLKLGFVTEDPLTYTDPPPPPPRLASMIKKLYAISSSMPYKANPKFGVTGWSPPGYKLTAIYVLLVWHML